MRTTQEIRNRRKYLYCNVELLGDLTYSRWPDVPNASCELGTLRQLSGRCLSLRNPGGYLVMGSSCYRDPQVFQHTLAMSLAS